ncbi:MAG: hypothetical protein C4519_00135 [Desulfobacteraceae bacterium]|nr:MAG: hypothetical protein C4519_00135 [Desulfobacteraceae bacterium]
MNNRPLHVKKRFDFEIGYLIKSPCRDCITRYRFPRCIRSCEILDRIQTHLAQGISSTHTSSALDPFYVQLEGRGTK